MKMMAGAFFSASSNAFRRLLSDSPASLDMISGPLIRKKKAPVSLATALAIRVFPARAHNNCLHPALHQVSSQHIISDISDSLGRYRYMSLLTCGWISTQHNLCRLQSALHGVHHKAERHHLQQMYDTKLELQQHMRKRMVSRVVLTNTFHQVTVMMCPVQRKSSFQSSISQYCESAV